ncbi:MAG: GDP-mannose 4,6-dehydratase, partial [Bacteroidaceae bacterium]|nr:GDP-mannose 4,6-dehydratase [Bacteroidaceae bacterium]
MAYHALFYLYGEFAKSFLFYLTKQLLALPFNSDFTLLPNADAPPPRPHKNIIFYQKDVCDKEALREIFKDNNIDGVIHFAGFKAVGESVSKPLKY